MGNKEYNVLYWDRSGVFGVWTKNEFGQWTFEQNIKVALSDEDMTYLLEELEKIKNEIK